MNNLSLVIINDNAADYCYKLFESIKEQLSFDDLDLIFIDNCSKDDSVAIAKHFGIKKIYSFNIKETNFGVLYNKGLELANQDYIIFAHSDVFFASDFFCELSHYLSNSSSIYDFTSFKQYYVDLCKVRRDRLGLDLYNQKLCISLNASISSQMEVYSECTESCFMINRGKIEFIKFNNLYSKSLYVFDFLEKVKTSTGQVGFFEGCRYFHYFIETHDILKTFPLDSIIFMHNYQYIYEKYMVNKHKIDDVCLRLNSYYSLLNRWLRKHQQSESIVDYFLEKQLMFVAIYGTGELAQNLYRELDGSKVQVVCFVCTESNENNKCFNNKPVITVNSLNAFYMKQQIDVIVVTPVYHFESIYKDLRNSACKSKIISLEEIINYSLSN